MDARLGDDGSVSKVVSVARNRLNSLRRVTDLFLTGRSVKVGESDEGPIYVWVAKPNTFEQGEARGDASTAATMKRYLLQADSALMSALDIEFDEADVEDIAEAIAAAKESLFFNQADQDIRADEAWNDRVQILDRYSLISENAPEEEREAFEKIQQEYLGEIGELVSKRQRETVADLLGLNRDALREKYRDIYLERHTIKAYLDAKTHTELYFALRECLSRDGVDHERCTHPRLLDSRDQASDLPDELVDILVNEIASMEIRADKAGN